MLRSWLLVLGVCGAVVVRADDCGSPPSVPGGRGNYSRTQTSFPAGTVVRYVCNAGYSAVGTGSTIICHQQGQWTRLSFQCTPIACGDPGSIPNSRRDGDIWTFKSKVTYYCLEGYIMRGRSAMRYCQANGKWSGDPPDCIIINCTQPENPESGAAVYRDLGYGSVVRYECQPRRAAVGDGIRVCQANGQWSGRMPRCVEVECALPNGPFSSGSISVQRGTQVGDILIYHCDNGTSLTAICHTTGTWDPPPPSCMNDTIQELTTHLPYVHNALTAAPPTTGRSRGFWCRWRIFQWLCRE